MVPGAAESTQQLGFLFKKAIQPLPQGIPPRDLPPPPPPPASSPQPLVPQCLCPALSIAAPQQFPSRTDMHSIDFISCSSHLLGENEFKLILVRTS